MELRATLLEDRSIATRNRVIRYIGNDPARFAELMTIFFNGEYRVAQRAAWPMSYCLRTHPELVRPHLNKMIALLEKDDVHPAITRNIVRALQDIEIPKRFHGRLMTVCFERISDPLTPVAIKAFSLTVLENLSKHYPDIREELRYTINDRMEHETAAFQSRAKKILKKI